jgi:hypothetical protein
LLDFKGIEGTLLSSIRAKDRFGQTIRPWKGLGEYIAGKIVLFGAKVTKVQKLGVKVVQIGEGPYSRNIPN